MRGNERGWTRREWLNAAAAGTMAAAAGVRLRAASKPWGVQIYTVRSMFKDQAAAAFKAIADIGYKEVELLSDSLAAHAALAKENGIAPVSLHIPSGAVTGTGMGAGTSLDKLVEDAKGAGIKYLVVSYLMPNERSQPGFIDKFIDAMGTAGEKVKAAGLQLGYHNHAFEFEKRPDGATVLEAMMAKWDRGTVKLEMDVFWVSVAGSDPVALLQKYSGRVALMHVKDKEAGTPVETSEMKVPRTAFKEVGSGSLDIRAILKAGEAAGVEHYFVEQDQTPGDPIASLRKSFEYLQKLS